MTSARTPALGWHPLWRAASPDLALSDSDDLKASGYRKMITTKDGTPGGLITGNLVVHAGGRQQVFNISILQILTVVCSTTTLIDDLQ
jgi:hypothetical protein